MRKNVNFPFSIKFSHFSQVVVLLFFKSLLLLDALIDLPSSMFFSVPVPWNAGKNGIFAKKEKTKPKSTTERSSSFLVKLTDATIKRPLDKFNSANHVTRNIVINNARNVISERIKILAQG